ncbi:hypothetical protein Bca52824_066309 [Brassica carinata]|uniref:Uncharacterized protein n=1 Tax=Brassica carinata TaxID=52824 RepID=A0A8X7UAT3_BRACI|nr:hypothetical protein Bca52824_066309 [Brassica carinata]
MLSSCLIEHGIKRVSTWWEYNSRGLWEGGIRHSPGAYRAAHKSCGGGGGGDHVGAEVNNKIKSAEAEVKALLVEVDRLLGRFITTVRWITWRNLCLLKTQRSPVEEEDRGWLRSRFFMYQIKALSAVAHAVGFWDYRSFINAAAEYQPLGLDTAGDKLQGMKEVAAFLGHVGSKTS